MTKKRTKKVVKAWARINHLGKFTGADVFPTKAAARSIPYVNGKGIRRVTITVQP